MQLNELRLISESEFNQWKSTWDGKSMPPDAVINYFLKVIEPARQDRLTSIYNEFFNEN